MPYEVEFTVLGEPQPKGSMRALLINGRPTAIPDNARSKKWEREVKLAASRVAPSEPLDGAMEVEFHFLLERPESTKFGMWPAGKPDWDKISRSTSDALTGVIYTDDARVVRALVTKNWGRPGAHIVVRSLEIQEELFEP